VADGSLRVHRADSGPKLTPRVRLEVARRLQDNKFRMEACLCERESAECGRRNATAQAVERCKRRTFGLLLSGLMVSFVGPPGFIIAAPQQRATVRQRAARWSALVLLALLAESLRERLGQGGRGGRCLAVA
jgi:hypothetical protein